MKHIATTLFFISIFSILSFGQDWKDFPVPVSLEDGQTWELQNSSDDFNYDAPADDKGEDFDARWTDYFHNTWTGPAPTVWQHDHSYVEDGKLKLKASRTEGETTTVTSGGKSYTLDKTYLGCITSKERVQYPVYIETYVKIMNSVLASDVWLLSADDTQEIDICEAYGGSRYTNAWFSNKRLHLSHHVFIRTPFTDWQPSDEGSFYTDGRTIWNEDYHRIGVYWRDPWHLEYYVDGKLVRTRSGKDQIDPNYHTNSVDPGDATNDTRTGLSKAMDIIINTEDQTWRAISGLTPTDRELSIPEDNTFKVDWIRIYKPVTVASVNKNDANNSITLSPNPCKDFIQIESEKTITQAELYNSDGKQVIISKEDTNSICLNTESLQAGIYILRLQTVDKHWVNEKIIKI